MLILAIDPGTAQSACVHWDGNRILSAKILPNIEVVASLEATSGVDVVVIEWIQSYGMAVGREVFITCRWCGRFEQAWRGQTEYMTRLEVKIHHCHSARANDSNVRTALVDRFGEPGKKKMPGLTYGLRKDLWSAFAIATAYYDQINGGGNG